MSQFKAQTITFAELKREQQILARRIIEIPLSNMSSRELSENAQAAAKQMWVYQRSYSFNDSQIDDKYSERLQGQILTNPSMTPKEVAQWKKEEKIKRAELKKQYEAEARTTVALANRYRAEMVKRLIPPFIFPEDKSRVAWFENPDDLLYKLDDNADYLDRLSKRLMEQQ